MEGEETTIKIKKKPKYKIIQKTIPEAITIPQPIIISKKLEITEYIDQLTSIEKIVLKIAQEQLESSFDIEKCIGFIEWKKNQDLQNI